MKPQPQQTFQIFANGKSQGKTAHIQYRPSAFLVEGTAAAASVCTSSIATLSQICRFVNSQLDTDTYKEIQQPFVWWMVNKQAETKKRPRRRRWRHHRAKTLNIQTDCELCIWCLRVCLQMYCCGQSFLHFLKTNTKHSNLCNSIFTTQIISFQLFIICYELVLVHRCCLNWS